MGNHTDRNQRPECKAPQFEFIPEELGSWLNWVCWRYEWGSTKWIKVPICVMTDLYAVTTDRKTWTELKHVQRYFNSDGPNVDGIGFVLTRETGIVAIDIDNCVQWENEKPVFDSWALAAINKLDDVYIEFSPSRCGLRILVRAQIDANRRYDKAGIEFYCEKQYVTITGDVWNAGEIKDRQVEVTEMIAKLDQMYRAERVDSKSTSEVKQNFISVDERLRIAFAAEDGLKIKTLFEGDMTGYEDSSEDRFDRSAADFGLCRRLCFYSDGNPGLLAEMMMRSALNRPKWQRRLGTQTYLEQLIEKCISTESKFYSAPAIISPLSNSQLPKKNRYMLSELRDAALVYRKRSDIYGLQCQFENLNKIYRPRPDLLTVWTGKPGAGKSTFILAYILDFAVRHNIRAGLCSFELNPPERLLLELVSIFGQCNPFDDSMDNDQISQIIVDLKNICTVFSLDFDQRSVDGIEPIIEDEIEENGMGIFYLDPFTELQPADRLLGKYTDFASQQLSRLKSMTEQKHLMTHLVCHPTKQGSARGADLSLTDINGSGDFERKADFGIVISREKGTQTTVVHLQKLRDRLTGMEDGKAAFELSQDCYYFREVAVPIRLIAEKESSAHAEKTPF